MKLIERIIGPTGKTHSATVIFFHGSGDTGNNLVEWIRFLLGRDIEFQHIKFIYPTAPVQPYTPLNGQNSNVWFDRKSIDPASHEHRLSMASIYETVNELLKRETATIPPKRVLVGGFSMGGALALHTAYHLNTKLGGVFAMSSFLNNNSIVYESLKLIPENQTSSLPKLLMFHGDRDTLVLPEWGKKTYEDLKAHNVQDAEFFPLRNTLHELKKQELVKLEQWISDLLPPLDTDLQNKL